jgi:hypothetical protein
MHTRVIYCLLTCLLLCPAFATAQTAPPPIYVTLWFDTEDYILPQSDDAAKRTAELLTRLGVKATFKIVGEKARTLEDRKRYDVIEALKKHEIGYHSNTHSMQPTIAVYLQHAGWEDGSAEFLRREWRGAQDIARIFGVTPICYGQPGSAWAPQSYPALHQMGIRMYLDEANHVGIDEQPFYYGGMLNVFKMRSNVVRMELKGDDNLAQAKTKFLASAEKLRKQGGGTISIYYHPCEFIHTEFWDGVNFRRGANPMRSEWKLPGVKPAAEIEKAFNDFEQYVKFIKALPEVRFVTVDELLRLYGDRAASHQFTRKEIHTLAKAVQSEISFQQLNGMTLSAAEIFYLLNSALNIFPARRELPTLVRPKPYYGPVRPFVPAAGGKKLTTLSFLALRIAARDTAEYISRNGRIPDEIWFGTDNLAPEDYLATIAAVLDEALASERLPDRVLVREGKKVFEKYVAENSPSLWGWVIFPEGFHAPKIMELARLQAWTLKPALLNKPVAKE